MAFLIVIFGSFYAHISFVKTKHFFWVITIVEKPAVCDMSQYEWYETKTWLVIKMFCGLSPMTKDIIEKRINMYLRAKTKFGTVCLRDLDKIKLAIVV